MSKTPIRSTDSTDLDEIVGRVEALEAVPVTDTWVNAEVVAYIGRFNTGGFTGPSLATTTNSVASGIPDELPLIRRVNIGAQLRTYGQEVDGTQMVVTTYAPAPGGDDSLDAFTISLLNEVAPNRNAEPPPVLGLFRVKVKVTFDTVPASEVQILAAAGTRPGGYPNAVTWGAWTNVTSYTHTDTLTNPGTSYGSVVADYQATGPFIKHALYTADAGLTLVDIVPTAGAPVAAYFGSLVEVTRYGAISTGFQDFPFGNP